MPCKYCQGKGCLRVLQSPHFRPAGRWETPNCLLASHTSGMGKGPTGSAPWDRGVDRTGNHSTGKVQVPLGALRRPRGKEDGQSHRQRAWYLRALQHALCGEAVAATKLRAISQGPAVHRIAVAWDEPGTPCRKWV